MIKHERGAPWAGDPSMVAEVGLGWHLVPSTVLLVERRLSESEVMALRTGAIEVHVLPYGPLIDLMLNIEGFGVMSALAYRTWETEDDAPAWLDESGSDSERLLLDLIVVEHTTGIVEVLRQFTLSPHVTKAIRRRITDTWDTRMSDAEAMEAVAAHQQRWPDIKAAMRASAARCKAGA